MTRVYLQSRWFWWSLGVVAIATQVWVAVTSIEACLDAKRERERAHAEGR